MIVSFDVPFVCPENIEPHLEKIMSGGEYDVRIALPGGRTILDLGANFGSFSVWASHRWPGSTIHSYEPHPDTFAGLLENVKIYPNITAYNFGLGDPGMRVMHDGLHNAGENSFHRIDNNPMATGRHLEVRSPLDLPEADIIKLDIEGCEREVLLPLIEAGRKFELILYEYHNNTLRRQLEALLSDDYELIGAEVQHIAGRGVMKWINRELHRRIFP